MTRKLKNSLETIADDLQYDMIFFKYLAQGCDNYEIIPVGGYDGIELTGEEVLALEEKAEELEATVLYRINMGTYSIVINPKTNITGIVSEDNPDGFIC